MANNLIIAMWSGPRNLSTALMRSIGNRKDVSKVLDEPFYASYLVNSNKDHPMRAEVIKSQSTDLDEVKNLCQKHDTGITYQKHMTQHIIDLDFKWMNKLKNCFLIRNPKMVVKSFMRSWEEGDFEDIGFNQQYEIYKYITNNVDDNPPILDATKIRNNPKQVLGKFCDAIEIPWDDNMLKWETGLKDYDGVWAPHWYPSVLKSNSFHPETNAEIILSDNEKKIVDKAMPIYEELLSKSI